MKNIRLSLFWLILLTVFLSIGCNITFSRKAQLIQSTVKWVSDSDYIAMPYTGLSKPGLNNVKLTPGTVLSQYNYYKNTDKNCFKGISSTSSECEMLDLMLDAYSYYGDKEYISKAVLIGNELTGRIFETSTNNKKTFFISNGMRFNNESNTWVQSSKSIYTRDQFKASYSLLKLYRISSDSKYLDYGIKLIDSQLSLFSELSEIPMKGALPYGYEVQNSNNNVYIPIKIYPLSLSKGIFESLSLAEAITGKKSYGQFKDENSKWLLNNINNASYTSVSKIIRGGFQKNGSDYISVNRYGDFWSQDFDVCTQDMMETLMALSYINPQKALEYQKTIEKICPQKPFQKELMTETLNMGEGSYFFYNSRYTTDMLSSIFRLEFLTDIKSQKATIDGALRAILSKVEDADPQDPNAFGGIRRYEDGPIDVETTAYFARMLLKHPEYLK